MLTVHLLLARRFTLSSAALQPFSCRWKSFRFCSSVQEIAKGMATSTAEVAVSEANSTVNLAWPSEAWTPESCQLFDELYARKDLTYLKFEVEKSKQPKNRLFPRSDEETTGNFFNYALFLNESERRMCGVVQYGPYTEGPKHFVHGGASATMCDAIMGTLLSRCGYIALTANLNVDYKAVVYLNKAYYMESNIEKVDGRKIFVSCRILDIDKKTVHVEGKALFIQFKSSGCSSPQNSDSQSNL